MITNLKEASNDKVESVGVILVQITAKFYNCFFNICDMPHFHRDAVQDMDLPEYYVT